MLFQRKAGMQTVQVESSPSCLFHRTSFLFKRTTETQTGYSDFSKINEVSLLLQGKQLAVFENMSFQRVIRTLENLICYHKLVSN